MKPPLLIAKAELCAHRVAEFLTFVTSKNHQDLIPQHWNVAQSKYLADIYWILWTACWNSNFEIFWDRLKSANFDWKPLSYLIFYLIVSYLSSSYVYSSHGHLVPPIFKYLTHLCRPVRSTFAVRETASLGIMGEPRVPPSETIVLSNHYRLWGV